MLKKLLFPDIETTPVVTAHETSTNMQMIWQYGSRIDTNLHDLSGLTFICETLPTGEFPDFAVSDLGCPIFSEKLRLLCDACGTENIEYFPVKIIEKEGEPSKSNYFAANIIGLVDDIDFANSDLDFEEEDGEVIGVDDIDTLVLKPTENGAIYRLKFFRRILVVEGNLLHKLESSKLKGLSLIEPEKWNGLTGEK